MLWRDWCEREGSDGLAPAVATTKLWCMVEQKLSPPKQKQTGFWKESQTQHLVELIPVCQRIHYREHLGEELK